MEIKATVRWTKEDTDRVWMWQSLRGLESFGTVPRSWEWGEAAGHWTAEEKREAAGFDLIDRFFDTETWLTEEDVWVFQEWVVSVLVACIQRSKASWWEGLVSDPEVAAVCAHTYQERAREVDETLTWLDDLLSKMISKEGDR